MDYMEAARFNDNEALMDELQAQDEENQEPCPTDGCNNFGTLIRPEDGAKVCEGCIGEATIG